MLSLRQTLDIQSLYWVMLCAGHSDQQHVQLSMEEDDALLQYAIQQSLVEAGTEQDQVDIWEALQADHRPTPRQQGSVGFNFWSC